MSGITIRINYFTILLGLGAILFGGAAGATEAAGLSPELEAATAAGSASALPWWGWVILLFVTTFLMGIVAVLGGVGGGVLFVPIVGGFFPFGMDFVRGAGLMVALAGALAAGPGLLRSGMASLRLAMPLALIASASAIVGAMIGLALPANVVNLALGIIILGIVALMWMAKKSEFPEVPRADNLSSALHITGIYHDAAAGKDINWKVHRTATGLSLFVGIGIMAGMFGLGAGWANIPVLNLLMGAPLKVSVASSKFMLSIVDTSAAWVYLNQGAILAIITVPSIIGIMLGSLLGVRLLKKVNASLVRKIVIVMLLVAGSRALLKGLGI
ncbi:permeases [Thiohalobacter thiocyanaticus]|uniref:Probable membrane transporter protein n=1 Tax=Thiohalobacter thiocyanaticus TaxID=585455 RepID=A0A1Z4VSJ0_9GAMM|nr:sulfite exporter TauE/SafE family protein [Thiohalobacter thiocyanaticus]BAZ94596.1 permeases [Thiohalobacter thiocyanaticus]